MSVREVLAKVEAKMKKAVSVTKEDFAGVRTGRASPALVERLMVDYYGTATPLQQLASFSVPETRVLLINAYDRSAVGSIEKSIRNSDLGLNPSADGNLVRLNFPPLTGERRKELAKMVRAKAEDGRVAIRNLRHTAKKSIEGLESDHEISQDDMHRGEKEMQSLTDKYVGEIDEMLEHKERELLED